MASMHILVVEDEHVLGRIIATNLAKRGHVVAEAETVARGMHHAQAAMAPFDIVLLDIMLPDGSGWEILRRLRESHGHAFVPVIIMTAVIPEPSHLASHAPTSVILKPFGIDALLRLIERVALPPDSSNRAAELAGPSV